MRQEIFWDLFIMDEAMCRSAGRMGLKQNLQPKENIANYYIQKVKEKEMIWTESIRL